MSRDTRHYERRIGGPLDPPRPIPASRPAYRPPWAAVAILAGVAVVVAIRIIQGL